MCVQCGNEPLTNAVKSVQYCPILHGTIYVFRIRLIRLISAVLSESRQDYNEEYTCIYTVPRS